MAGIAESRGGFGLMRAIERARRMPQTEIITGPTETRGEAPSTRRRSKRPPSEFAAEQQRLSEQGKPELWPLPGLAPMTRVRTNFGDVHSIALRKGDKVLTKSGDYLAIEWINRIMLDEHILDLKPDSNPIVVSPGALGMGMPSAEIMVSPRQIFCAEAQTDLPEAREASTLLARTGVRRIKETGLTYTMFHVGESADIYCEGLFLRFPIEA